MPWGSSAPHVCPLSLRRGVQYGAHLCHATVHAAAWLQQAGRVLESSALHVLSVLLGKSACSVRLFARRVARLYRLRTTQAMGHASAANGSQQH